MRKITFLLILFFTLNGTSVIFSQDSDWIKSTFPNLENKMTKVDGNIRYFIDSYLSSIEMDSMTIVSQQYINQNLDLINESDFIDSLYIILVQNKDEMIKYTGHKISGIALLKDEFVPQNMVCCIPKVLKHELMHIITQLKWGLNSDVRIPDWLTEGLAVYANPEAESCDKYTLEQKYIYFLQNEMLLSSDMLIQFPSILEVDTKVLDIAYNQAGYIVSFLIDKYGIDKLRMLWSKGMNDFDKIYECSFEDMISKIRDELKLKHPCRINITDCELFDVVQAI